MGHSSDNIDARLNLARTNAFGWHEALEDIGPGTFNLEMWLVEVVDEMVTVQQIAADHPDRRSEADEIVAQLERFAAQIVKDIAARGAGDEISRIVGRTLDVRFDPESAAAFLRNLDDEQRIRLGLPRRL
jgi:hypothetical protein